MIGQKIHFEGTQFEITLATSVLIHLLLMAWSIIALDFTNEEESPLKARIGIRFEDFVPKPPSLPTKTKDEETRPEKLMSEENKKFMVPEEKTPNLEAELLTADETGKLLKPSTPPAKKPVLEKTSLPKPSLLKTQQTERKPAKTTPTKSKVPQLEIRQPSIGIVAQPSLVPQQKQPLKLEKTKPRLPKLKKTTLNQQLSPKILSPKRLSAPINKSSKPPIAEKKPLPPSTITSRRSKLIPSRKPSLMEPKPLQPLKVPVPKPRLSHPTARVSPIPKPLAGKNKPRLNKAPLPEPKLPNAKLPDIQLPRNPAKNQQIPQVPPSPEPKDLTGKLPLPASQNRLPEPKLLTSSLGDRLPTTPILRPKPLKTPDIHSVEQVLVPEKEIEAEVPMLDINFGSETGMSEETDFARKLKYNQQIKQAEKEYNIHIQAMVQPKLGGFDPELFVRIELEIETSGKITSFRLLEQSSSKSFNQAAELAIRNANLNPLPEALAKNPPYIVVVRIIPPIQ